VLVTKGIDTFFKPESRSGAYDLTSVASFVAILFPAGISYALDKFSNWQIVPPIEAAAVALLVLLTALLYSDNRRPKMILDNVFGNMEASVHELHEKTPLKQNSSYGGLYDINAYASISDNSKWWQRSNLSGPPGRPVSDGNPFCSALFWLIALQGMAFNFLWAGVSMFAVEMFDQKGEKHLESRPGSSPVNLFFYITAFASIACFVVDAILLRLCGMKARIWVLSTHSFALAAACIVWVFLDGQMLILAFGILLSFARVGDMTYILFDGLWGAEYTEKLRGSVLSTNILFTGLGPLVIGVLLDYPRLVGLPENSRNFMRLFFLLNAALNSAIGILLLLDYYAVWHPKIRPEKMAAAHSEENLMQLYQAPSTMSELEI